MGLTQNNDIHYAKITLSSVFVISNLHLDLVNSRTNLEINGFSISLNFEELSFNSLGFPGLFLKVFIHLERLYTVRSNKAAKHIINLLAPEFYI
jgi:hypothetical protein